MINQKVEVIERIHNNYINIINITILIIIVFLFIILLFLSVIILLVNIYLHNIKITEVLILNLYNSYLTVFMFVFVNTLVIILLQLAIRKFINFKYYFTDRLQDNDIACLNQPNLIETQISFSRQVLKKEYQRHTVRDVNVPLAQVTRPSDPFTLYEIGLNRLLKELEQKPSHHSAVLTYQQRLTENIRLTRRYRDTEERKAERTQVITQLNHLASSTLGISFNELCEQE